MKEQGQKEAERISNIRANETLEETQKRRFMEAERASINRANETPEKSKWATTDGGWKGEYKQGKWDSWKGR